MPTRVPQPEVGELHRARKTLRNSDTGGQLEKLVSQTALQRNRQGPGAAHVRLLLGGGRSCGATSYRP
jgi:hypothetical protein